MASFRFFAVALLVVFSFVSMDHLKVEAVNWIARTSFYAQGDYCKGKPIRVQDISPDDCLPGGSLGGSYRVFCEPSGRNYTAAYYQSDDCTFVSGVQENVTSPVGQCSSFDPAMKQFFNAICIPQRQQEESAISIKIINAQQTPALDNVKGTDQEQTQEQTPQGQEQGGPNSIPKSVTHGKAIKAKRIKALLPK